MERVSEAGGNEGCGLSGLRAECEGVKHVVGAYRAGGGERGYLVYLWIAPSTEEQPGSLWNGTAFVVSADEQVAAEVASGGMSRAGMRQCECRKWLCWVGGAVCLGRADQDLRWDLEWTNAGLQRQFLHSHISGGCGYSACLWSA